MISFEEFKEILREEVANKVDGEVSIVTVAKNNGVKLDALSVKSKLCNIAPLVYLDSFYKDYKKGRSIDSIVMTIVSINEQDSGINKEVINNFCDYDVMKEYLEIKLINKESNKELLKTVPHLDFLDLVIVCMIKLPFEKEKGAGTVLIHKHHFEKWDISIDEMFDVAANNSMEKNPAVIRCMNDVIKEMYIGNCDLEEQEEDELCTMIDSMDSKLYVLTNQTKINGSVTIAYQDVLRDFAEKKNSNLYILPSSIHEVIILLEEENTNADDLRAMVQSVNSTELDEMEVLSNSVYYYDRELDKITIA